MRYKIHFNCMTAGLKRDTDESSIYRNSFSFSAIHHHRPARVVRQCHKQYVCMIQMNASFQIVIVAVCNL